MAHNNRNNSGNQVAVIQPARMQMPRHVAEEYDLNEDSWRALVDAVFPTAKTVGAVAMALAYCAKNHLDIFQRPVHIVPMYVNGRQIESVWPGIAQIRIVAQRQPTFAGYDDCVFGPDITTEFKGKAKGQNNSTYDVEATVTHPEWAQFTVYKMLHGQRIALPGPKVWFFEAMADKASATGSCPNEMWQKRPRGQLEKCAEAAALRRAFPDVLGNEYAMEEMEGRNPGEGVLEGRFVEVEDDAADQRRENTTAAPKRKPKRSDYQETEKREQPRTDETRQTAKRNEPVEQSTEQSNSPLDSDDIPGRDQWPWHVDLVRERLGSFVHTSQVDEFQQSEQFRTDCAPPAVQAELLEMFSDRAAELDGLAKSDDAGKDDQAEQDNGGSDNEESSD